MDRVAAELRYGVASAHASKPHGPWGGALVWGYI
jgi:hypothetical protein